MNKKFSTAKALAVSAVMVALASVISLFLKFESPFPFGGSVTVGSMVPIILVAFLLGPKWGILSSVCFSLVQLAAGVGQVATWGLSAGVFVGCLLLDYIGAYSIISVASVFKGRRPWTIVLAALCACVGRFLFHFLSGLLFFGMWKEAGFNDLTWAIVYNGGYMLPETAICVAICAAIIPVIPEMRRILGLENKD